MACFMVKHGCGAVRPPYCTGMRILIISLLTVGSVLLAQEQPASIKVDVDLVNILTSVRDKRGGLIPNLQKEDFTILEDGKAQTIKYFTKETDLPLTIGLLVDVSGSQRNLIDIERSAASQFFRDVLRKKDLAFLISFGEENELLQDYTGSARLLTEGLGQLRVSSGVSGIHPGPVPTMGGPRGTVLYDAIYLAADEKLKNEVGRKAMIVFTDGEDEGSRLRIRDAIEAAQKADTICYVILIADRGGWYQGFGLGDMRKLAEETGGRVIEVGNNQEKLRQAFDQIQNELRSQYNLGYTPTNNKLDGSYRKIQIHAKGGDYKVQARQGYYAMGKD